MAINATPSQPPFSQRDLQFKSMRLAYGWFGQSKPWLIRVRLEKQKYSLPYLNSNIYANYILLGQSVVFEGDDLNSCEIRFSYKWNYSIHEIADSFKTGLIILPHLVNEKLDMPVSIEGCCVYEREGRGEREREGGGERMLWPYWNSLMKKNTDKAMHVKKYYVSLLVLYGKGRPIVG